MTPFQLQKDLCDEIENILKDMLFKDVSDNLVQMRAYPQELPKREQTVTPGNIMADEEYEEDPYPFCVVRLDSGSMRTPQEANEIKTVLVLGVYDDDVGRQGHTAILNAINRISERFMKNPILRAQYRLNYDAGISWTLDDEDRYPYYFGAMEMTFNTFFTGMEEDIYA